MKYIITGATGFVGYNLVLKLNETKEDVKVLVRNASLFKNMENVEVALGDISNYDFLDNEITCGSIVIHLAGLIDLSNKSELQEGIVINALSQFKGVGQFENKWESESGKNLTFSLLLQPRFLNPASQFLLTQVLSLAISDYLLTQTDKPISIKWPNDIYIGKKKICGILVKNQLFGATFENSF